MDCNTDPKVTTFIFSESKKDVILELKNGNESLSLKPGNILKEIPDVFVYSNQFE